MIERVTICRWGAGTLTSQDVDDPGWEVIESAIRALNGRDLNDLYLYPDRDQPETWIGVGGGDGRYLVTGSIRNESFPVLVRPGAPEGEEVLLTVGGQDGEYPATWIVDLERALEAARDVFDASGFDGETPWTHT